MGTEKYLREENMLLRQELIKLKKALYMNVNETQMNSFDNLPQMIQDQSPKIEKKKST